MAFQLRTRPVLPLDVRCPAACCLWPRLHLSMGMRLCRKGGAISLWAIRLFILGFRLRRRGVLCFLLAPRTLGADFEL